MTDLLILWRFRLQNWGGGGPLDWFELGSVMFGKFAHVEIYCKSTPKPSPFLSFCGDLHVQNPPLLVEDSA